MYKKTKALFLSPGSNNQATPLKQSLEPDGRSKQLPKHQGSIILVKFMGTDLKNISKNCFIKAWECIEYLFIFEFSNADP